MRSQITLCSYRTGRAGKIAFVRLHARARALSRLLRIREPLYASGHSLTPWARPTREDGLVVLLRN